MKPGRGLLRFTLALLLAGAVLDLAAQSSESQAYVIRSVEFEIEGRTREYFLRKAVDIQIGARIIGKDAFVAFLADRRQVLLNERVLEEVEARADYGEAEADGAIPVSLLFETKDTWNVIALPYFKYDSNDGLLLSARGRDYNFFGTMEPLRVNLNYTLDTEGTDAWSVDFDFSLPMVVAEHDAEWGLSSGLGYTPGEPVHFDLSTDLAMFFPASVGSFTIGASQGIVVNDENADGTFFEDIWFLTSSASGSYALPLTPAIGRFGALTWSPSISLAHNWRPDGDVLEEREGPTLTLSHSLGFGRVDWIGNFREGLEATISNPYALNLDSGTWDRSLRLSGSAFAQFGWFGMSGSLDARYYFDGAVGDLGGSLRGILDRRVSGDAALLLNLDLPVRTIVFKPSQWFAKDWMRLFDFEQHWSPFLDIGLGHWDGSWFAPSDGWYSGGLEIITFPKIMRSFYVRISVGFDMTAVLENRSLSASASRDGESPYEIFFGLGHHY